MERIVDWIEDCNLHDISNSTGFFFSSENSQMINKFNIENLKLWKLIKKKSYKNKWIL